MSLSPAFTTPNTRFCPPPQSIALLSLSFFTSVASCTKFKLVLPPCNTFFSFSRVGHGGHVLSPSWSGVTVPGVLQVLVASIPSEMVFLEGPGHFEAVWLPLPCSCSSELLGVSVCLLGFYVNRQATRKGARWGLPGFLLFLPVLGLEGICQNNFSASAHKRTSAGSCLPSGRGSIHQWVFFPSPQAQRGIVRLYIQFSNKWGRELNWNLYSVYQDATTESMGESAAGKKKS